MEDSTDSITLDSSTPAMVTSNWFSVSTTKFIIMSVCTLGLYELYWFYKNWTYIKNLENTQIWPFWRALFAQFTAYFLFKRVRADVQEHALSNAVPAGGLAALFFLLNGAWRLPDPYWYIVFMTFAPLLVANEAMTEINKKLVGDFQQNSRIRGWNWVAIVLGGITVALSVLAAFLPPDA